MASICASKAFVATRSVAKRNCARPVLTRSRNAVVRASFVEDMINSFSVAVKNSPLNQGKKALAIAQAGDYDVNAIQGKISALLADNKVVVFSFTTCPFCVKAKNLLNELGVKYTAVELNTMDKEGMAIRAELAKMTDRTSMPNVFIAGKSVGGCNDGPGVFPLNTEGKLVPMLKAAGAL